MATVIAHLHVDPDGRITGQAASSVPAGDYTTLLELTGDAPTPRDEASDALDWPVHDCGPWPTGLSLRREELYGDDGR